MEEVPEPVPVVPSSVVVTHTMEFTDEELANTLIFLESGKKGVEMISKRMQKNFGELDALNALIDKFRNAKG